MDEIMMGNKHKLSAEGILVGLIDEITSALEEIKCAEEEGDTDEFMEGAKGAYVTCLELIAYWEKAEENGLDYDIEEVYPV